jgi:hypothetical protein
MTAIEQLWRRLGELPSDQREAMAARLLEAWDALQWNEQPSASAEAEKSDSSAEPVPYERIEHLVGSIEGLGDLSGANPTKYMEGFGESRRRQG